MRRLTLQMLLLCALLSSALPAVAQTSAVRITVPSVTVTAQKEPADAQRLPLSVTTLSWEALTAAGVTEISEAALYSPNTYFSELTARKISNARFRGIGSSPANPGITTYIDGVPQLSTNSSSIELLQVEQLEFVRGPQSALFGRNTLGGLINITSVRPSLYDWHGSVTAPIGNFSTREVRANVSGPLTPRLGVGVAVGYAARDGYTTNAVTGNDLDSQSAVFGKAQLLWTPTSIWEARLIVNGERARDGDYALSDLGSLRANKYDTARDFEGETSRDIFSTSLLTRREGARVSLTSTTGLVRWTTADSTDLDYSPLALITRDNDENAVQFTQEVRLASAAAAPISLGDGALLRWQAGASFFTQQYEQDAVNNFSPFVLSPFVRFPVSQHSPEAALDDVGFGAFAQGTVAFNSRLELTAGARLDYESKDATLKTFFEPAIAAPTNVTASETYTNVSPQFAVSYAFRPQTVGYVSGGGGFKAGGFNPASPAGLEAYAEEKTRHLEGGVKSTWADGRLTANAAVFYIDWDDMQLNVPNPGVPGQFFISNVGAARSTGVELELGARPAAGVDLFGSFGVTNATFKAGSRSMGLDVTGNDVPNTPGYTAMAGAQYTRPIVRSWSWFVRGEAGFYGGFHYDEANTAEQDAFSIANLRAGVQGRRYGVDIWMKNAFDTFYVPIAFAFPGLAPSGFIGEPGRPRTFGVSLTARF